ncbi:protein of unknown function [Candidatus Nitrotoga arctica]|uniref:Transposase n=1 Tax=Candidatus Nitrotoga arctica TaxID=453162 RepID=A0ABM8Z0F3_9PROT|nr:protein of unknown function [Candidatus Nitrotoga arctica]
MRSIGKCGLRPHENKKFAYFNLLAPLYYVLLIRAWRLELDNESPGFVASVLR